jgi:chromosome segregation ATPase
MSNTDEKILKALEDLQVGQKNLQADVQKQGKRLETLEAGQKTLQADVSVMKDVQQKQGKRLEAVESGQNALRDDVAGIKTDVAVLRGSQKTLESGQQALELKVEAIHAYQQQAHDEIMGHLIDTAEIAGRDQKILEKRIERIEKHLGLPPLK